MKFEYQIVIPTGLILTIFLVIWMYFAIKKEKRRKEKWAENKLLIKMLQGHNKSVILYSGIFIIISFLLLIMALAKPVGEAVPEEGEVVSLDIYILLDISKSMYANDIKPNRLEAAKNAISSFVDNLKGDRVGLVLFAGEAFVYCPLTRDYDAFKTIFERVDVNLARKQGTMIGEAIREAILRFPEKENVGRVILLITDGEDHGSDPEEASREALENKITIFTVGIGSKEGAYVPEGRDVFGRIVYKEKDGERVITKLNEDILKKIADITGGEYFYAPKEKTLIRVLDKISNLSRERVKVIKGGVPEELYHIFLIPGLVSFIMGVLIISRPGILRKIFRKGG